MNFVDGRVEPVDGGTLFTAENDALRWHLPEFRLANPVANVSLGIRPEHITLTRITSADGVGIVSLVEPVGAVTYVDLELGGLAFKVSTDPATEFALGEHVTVTPNPKRVFLFDPITGDRIRG